MSGVPQNNSRPLKKQRTKCVRFASPQVTQRHELPSTLGEFLAMFSMQGKSEIKITQYENGKEPQTILNVNRSNVLSTEIYPDPGKLKQMHQLRLYQVKCSQIENQQETCQLTMTEIDDALEYGEGDEEQLTKQYNQLKKQSNALSNQLDAIKKIIDENKQKLFNATECPSQKFLHILITNPQVVCPYKKQPNVEVTKTTILESFMCVSQS